MTFTSIADILLKVYTASHYHPSSWLWSSVSAYGTSHYHPSSWLSSPLSVSLLSMISVVNVLVLNGSAEVEKIPQPQHIVQTCCCPILSATCQAWWCVQEHRIPRQPRFSGNNRLLMSSDSQPYYNARKGISTERTIPEWSGDVLNGHSVQMPQL